MADGATNSPVVHPAIQAGLAAFARFETDFHRLI
jgi:hypothetical protein